MSAGALAPTRDQYLFTMKPAAASKDLSTQDATSVLDYGRALGSTNGTPS